MNAQMEQQIRERAYQIWIEAGMTQGLEQEHWVAAERDIAAASGAKPPVSKRATASKTQSVVATPVAVKKAKVKTVEAKHIGATAKTAKGAKSAMTEARGSLN